MNRPMEITREQISMMLVDADQDTAAVIRARLNLIGSLETLTGELRKSDRVFTGMTEAATGMSEALDRI